MNNKYNIAPLCEVMTHYQDYIDEPEPITYPKLSVKLYGKGAVLDNSVEGSDLKMKKHQIAKKGQVILSEIWGKKGAIGIVPPEGDGALCTSHFFLFDVRDDKIEQKYLQAIFTANYLEEHLNVEAQGTTGYAAVRPKHLLAATIPLPPLEEQRRIVARIEELAAKIEEARGLRREAVEEANVLISSVTASLLVSNQWEKKPIGDLLRENSQNGLSSFPSSTPPGIPILRISSATSRDDAIIDEQDYKFIDIDDQICSKYKLERNDILVCRFNGNLHNVGKFALYQNHSGLIHVYPDKLIRLRVDSSKVLPEFICLAANSPEGRKTIESFCATTAGNIGISATSLKSITVPTPPLAEQEKIINHISNLQSYKDTLKYQQSQTSAELNALLPSILDKAFKGEL